MSMEDAKKRLAAAQVNLKEKQKELQEKAKQMRENSSGENSSGEVGDFWALADEMWGKADEMWDAADEIWKNTRQKTVHKSETREEDVKRKKQRGALGTLGIVSIILGSVVVGGLAGVGAKSIVDDRRGNPEADQTAEEMANMAQSMADMQEAMHTYEKGQAEAISNLTDTDLLKDPCSPNFIDQYDPNMYLCAMTHCRMSRQGGGANSGGGAGATQEDCSQITRQYLGYIKWKECGPVWDEDGENGKATKFGVCEAIFNGK